MYDKSNQWYFMLVACTNEKVNTFIHILHETQKLDLEDILPERQIARALRGGEKSSKAKEFRRPTEAYLEPRAFN